MAKQATINLRWFKRKGGKWVLQQQIRDIDNGELTWENIPFIEEEE